MTHPGDIEIFDPEWDPALLREYVELFRTILVSFFVFGSEKERRLPRCAILAVSLSFLRRLALSSEKRLGESKPRRAEGRRWWPEGPQNPSKDL